MNGMKRPLLFVIALMAMSCIRSPDLSAAEWPAVFQHGAGDIKYTVEGFPFLVMVGGGMTAGFLSQWDSNVANHFRDDPRLGKADTVGKWLGSAYVWDSAALATWGAGLLSKSDMLSVTGESMVEALVFTEALAGGIKLAVNRQRPDGGNYSFPSSHAARTFAVASVLETLHGPAVGVPAFLLAGFISYTRIDSDSHYLSDVLFGAAIGSAIGWGTARFHKYEKRQFFVMPSVGRFNGVTFACNF